MRVLLPARDIPLNSTVTMRIGESTYRVTNSIKIYATDLSEQFQTIIAKEGAIFLIPLDNVQGSITAICSKTPLLWQVDEKELKHWIDTRLNES